MKSISQRTTVQAAAHEVTITSGVNTRAQYLKHHPLCVMCLEKGIYTPATVIDHIKPVENGQADPLFWVESNHQSLCRDCHSYKTRVIDQRGFGAKK
nr:MAG TPA: HNH endonuclease [Caudoviricetes sp.]